MRWKSSSEQITVCVPDRTQIITRDPECPSQKLDWRCQVQCENVQVLGTRGGLFAFVFVFDGRIREQYVSLAGK